MPLLMFNTGETVIVERVSAKEKKHFEDLGIIHGTLITIVSKNPGGLIIEGELPIR